VTPDCVVAVGAHPDDAEFFAGATLGNFAAKGAKVFVVICTDGARGGAEAGAALAELRRVEAERAALALGIRPPILLGRADGALEADEPLRRDLVRELRRLRPTLVLLHDPSTWWTPLRERTQLGHSDHRAAGQATLDALYPRLLLAGFYPELAAEGLSPWFAREAWLFDTAAPDHFVPVEEPGAAAKREALSCHESQHVGGLLRGAAELEEAFGKPLGVPAEAFRRLVLF
jgi:LmbE family N-acetylglucosaminyl deacetylase